MTGVGLALTCLLTRTLDPEREENVGFNVISCVTHYTHTVLT